MRGLEALCLCPLLGGCLTEHQFDPEGSLGKQRAQVSLYLEHEGASPDLSLPTGGPVQTECLQCPLRRVWKAQGQPQCSLMNLMSRAADQAGKDAGELEDRLNGWGQEQPRGWSSVGSLG